MKEFCVTVGVNGDYWYFVNADNYEFNKTSIIFRRDGVIVASTPKNILNSLELVEGDKFTKIDIRKE